MALGAKESGQIHNKTGGDLAAMVAKYDANAHHSFIGFDEVDVMLHQMQLMQNDIDELRRFVANASELRTIVSPLPIANGGTGLTASQPLLYSKITISSGEMASLDSTRKTLLAAPGADKIIVPVSIVIMCDKLNSNPNTTLTNLYGGYYNNDNRDITRAQSHEVLGLLYNQRSGGSYHINPAATMYRKQSEIVNKEFALLLSVAPGVNGATTSEVLFSYYIADVS